jgi:succinate dehydrogenase / fumarate reductase, flavoprotein subunit
MDSGISSDELNFKTIFSDVLIIGAGAAGIRTAIELKKSNIDCLIIGKRKHGDAHTIKAAGGINAALANLDEEDNWDIHAADTFREGHFINCPAAVERVCKDAAERIKELKEWGCDFDLTDEGKINQRYFGAQSFRRTCFVGDRTGEAILETLVNKAKELKIPYWQNIFIVRIFTQENQAWGALGFDRETQEYYLFQFKAVVLAAGGYSGIYERHSSRKDENTGDGPALALNAGASLKDMEFVQFHPTGMVYPEEFEGTLVTEATRGEGGWLFNSKGERFMENYSPEQMELDARDVVARAIFQEIEEGRGTENKGVFLDISHKEEEFIKERLPTVYQRFKELGVDISKEAMEIAPTAHYSMGGVDTNFSTGATSVKGLFAVGEVTAGLHGANRLGGNSLLETVALGKICGKFLLKFVRQNREISFSLSAVKNEIRLLEGYKKKLNGENPLHLIKKLQSLMWNTAGINRTSEKLQKGLVALKEIEDKAKNVKVAENETGATLENICNLLFMIPVANAVLRSALIRQESRGAHFRKDFPEIRDEWKKNIICTRYQDNGLLFTTKPVPPASSKLLSALKKHYTLNYHHLE